MLANVYPNVTFGHSGVTGTDPYGAVLGSSLPGGAITFHSNGTVQDAAGVYVESGNGDEHVQQAVTLSGAGRVRVWKYSEGAWQ